MLPPLMVTVAGKVGGALVAGLTPRVKALLVGTDDQRALDKAIRRATNAAFEDVGDEVVDLTPERYFGNERLSAVLIDSAFAGNDPDPVRIAAILVELGHDANTSPVDLVRLAVDIGVQLQAEIRRAADTSGGALFNRLVLAKLDGLAARSVASNAAPRQVTLPPLPALIVGREPDFTAIRDRVLRGTQAATMGVTVVRGWPGVGKSTLAASVTHAALDWNEFPDGVLWTALGEAGDARTALVSWLRQLGKPATADSVDELSAVLGGLLRGRRILLVVDDAWQAEHATPLLVGTGGSAALVTTRSTEAAQRLAPRADGVYVLGVLGEEASLTLLSALAPTVVRDHRDESAELAREVEGLPLALQVAGRLLAAEASLGLGVSELLAELREGSRILAAQAPPDRADLANATTPTVAALLAQSTDRLSAQQREQFAFLGAFAEKPATFDVAAIGSVWGVKDPRPGIRVLVARGLLEPTANQRFQMHALLALHARALIEEL
jgi:NB-ARC domain